MSLDQSLRCNSLPCRKLLYTQGRAVSTSCSHIFCHDCAVALFRGRRSCPACETVLEGPDDCVITNLDPSSSYKSSILAGLTPTVIMEICSRAISFFQYQATQEAAFQQVMLNKSQEMLERYALENETLERNAEAEMSLMKQKMKALQDELTSEKNKNQEMRQAAQTSRRDYEKLRSQLENARRQAIGNDGINSSRSNNMNLNESTNQMMSSAPKPFYAGRSMNSPIPFLNDQQKQQSNLWQNQMKNQQQQSYPTRTLENEEEELSMPIQQSKSTFLRRSVTPLVHPRTEILRAPGPAHLRNLPVRNSNTPIRAMPLPGGYSTPRQRQGPVNGTLGHQ